MAQAREQHCNIYNLPHKISQVAHLLAQGHCRHGIKIEQFKNNLDIDQNKSTAAIYAPGDEQTVTRESISGTTGSLPNKRPRLQMPCRCDAIKISSAVSRNLRASQVNSGQKQQGACLNCCTNCQTIDNGWL